MRKLLYILLLFGSIVQAQFSPMAGVIASQGGINDVYPSDNAASVPVEFNSIGSDWSNLNSDRMTFASVTDQTVSGSTYSLKWVMTSDAGSGRAELSIPVVNGKTYTVTCKYRFDDGAGATYHYARVYPGTNMSLPTSFTSWVDTSGVFTDGPETIFTATGTGTGIITFYASPGGGGIGNTWWIDNMIIVESE